MIQKIRNSVIMQLICIVFAVLIVLAVTLSMSYFYVKQTTRNYAETLAESLLKQADNELSLYEESLRYNAEALCRFLVMDHVNGNSEGLTGIRKEVQEAQLSSYFSQIVLKDREIVSALIFDNDMNQVVTLGKQVELPEKQIYLRQEEDLNADRYFTDKDDFYYGFYYPIYSETGVNSQQLGMCVFIVEHWKIDGSLHNILNDSISAMLLSDSNNLDLSFHAFGNVPEGTTMADLKADDDYVYREGNWQNGIRIAVAVSVSGSASGNVVIRNLIILAAVLSSVLLSIIIFFSYYQMARPIHMLDRFIVKSISHPDRRLNLNRTDEIGTVAASLDNMLDENQRMIKEIKESKIRLYETKLSQQKMEILAYRNQINPHFLYNTLSCMRDMALIKDEDSIAEMAMCLSDIFRYAVKGSNIVTVRDEVSYIEKYARIIEYRFMGKIMIDTNIDEAVMDTPVIRFLLQPLVENSVFHGLEGKMEPGYVEVNIESVGDRLEITVEDDGTGMDAETLENLREDIKNPTENRGVGLSNVVQRLRLFYEEDYTMTVDSEVGKGTVIRLSVPDHIRESK